MKPDWASAAMWLATAVLTFGLCVFLPIRIQDPETRKKVSWFILIPVSVILILYVYPAGIELFKRLAVSGR